MWFRQVFDERLAQYAYLVGCPRTGEALVIDPQRDVDRYVALAEEEGLRLTAAAETHIHADFLSGVRELAHRFGVRVYLSGEGGPDWRYTWPERDGCDHVFLKDGDTFRLGRIELRVLHTPGHTPEHIVFAITDRGGGADEPMGVATGDFVFVGDLGRPDLLESAAKHAGQMEPSARRLHGSVLRFLELPDWLQVWPGHGAGSACGKALGAVPETTVGYEKRFNPAVAAARRGEDAFVDYILSGQPEPPLYFARMKRQNREGPPILGALPSPRKLSGRELAELAGREDELVIDTRASRSDFMLRHLPGSLYAPLTRAFPTAVGSMVVDEATPLHLIVEEGELEEAVRELVRIGYDRVVGWAEPKTLARHFMEGGAAATIPEVDFEGMEREAADGGTVLDVRFASEFEAGHVPDAVNASYTRLPETVAALPKEGPLLVHCATGARSAVAASWLARQGRSVRYVSGRFEDWARDGQAVKGTGGDGEAGEGKAREAVATT